MVFVKLESIPTYMGYSMENEFKKPEKSKRLIGQTINANSSDIFLQEL
jgi:hypothetical protein